MCSLGYYLMFITEFRVGNRGICGYIPAKSKGKCRELGYRRIALSVYVARFIPAFDRYALEYIEIKGYRLRNRKDSHKNFIIIGRIDHGRYNRTWRSSV